MYIFELSREGTDDSFNNIALFKAESRIVNNQSIELSTELPESANIDNEVKTRLSYKILMDREVELNVCKTWNNLCCIGDTKGNILILDRVVVKKSKRENIDSKSM